MELSLQTPPATPPPPAALRLTAGLTHPPLPRPTSAGRTGGAPSAGGARRPFWSCGPSPDLWVLWGTL